MKLVPFVILLLFMTGCSALPTPLEMGDMVFIRTLGVDGTSENLALTASTGQRGQGLQQNSQPSLTLTGEGNSLSGAALDAGSASDQQVFYGYLDQLLLGEDYCGDGILPVLEYFARDVELGLGAEVWAIAGSASEAIQSGGESGITDRLTTLQLEHLRGSSAMTQTAGDALTDILEKGATYLPRLAVDGEGNLISAGYAIFSGDVLQGALVGEQSYGLELLEGNVSGDVFSSGEGIVLEIWGANWAVTPILVGDQLQGMHIQCTVTANLSEYDSPPDSDTLDLVGQELAQMEENRIATAIAQLQAMNADAVGLGRQLGMKEPELWGDWEEQWDTLFSELSLWVTVDVNIGRN